MKYRLLTGLLFCVALLSACAEAGPEDVIRARIKAVLPDIEITSIRPLPVAGLYIVNASNYESVMATADGRYLIQGELLELKGNRIVSVEDPGLLEERQKALAAVKPADMVVFPATGARKGVVYVFTDVDCGYCRKLHNEMSEINKRGIEVRYLAFPRSGPGTPLAQIMSNVWCAPDRGKALTDAKAGKTVPAAAPGCKSPVDAQYALGNKLGVRGTPAIFSEAGAQLGGYLPAAGLAKALDSR